METTYQVIDDILVARVVGDLSQTAVNLNSDLMSQVQDNDCSGVLINLSKIQFLNSAGLGLIVSIMNNTKSNQKKFGICCLNEYNLETFKISGLDQALSIFETEEEGINEFKKD